MTVFIMNTDRKTNPSKPSTNESDANILIVEKKSGTIIAISNMYGDIGGFSKIGDWSLITIDTGLRHRDGGSGKIVGIVTPDSTEGVIPTRKVPVYVFK